MIFQFPKKKIVLDCFTADEVAIRTAPIDFAIKHMPEWWQDLPATYTRDSFPFGTMKNCAGMVDFYRYSIAIPMWSDLVISIGKNQFSWKFSDYMSSADLHNTAQEATGFLPPNYNHLKLISPWHLSCKQSINWLWNTPLYNLNKNPDILIPPGIVNYSKQNITNVNILFNTEKERVIKLAQGSPIAMITPMTDRKIEIVRHLVSRQELERKSRILITFNRPYDRRNELVKKFKDCPFHNHVGRK